MSKQTPAQSRKQYYKITCQNKHTHNQNKTILEDHMSKQTPTQSKQNNITKSDHMSKQTPTQSIPSNTTRSHVNTNTHTIKTKQYYKITCQNKHPHYQDKIILQDDMSKQTPTQSRQNNITRSDDKTNTHNQDKTILQDHMWNTMKTKQYYKTHDKTNTHTIKTTILQDHMSKQTPTQWRLNNTTRTQVKTNTPHNQDNIILENHMSKQTPTQSKQNNITTSHVKTNTHTIKTI